MKKVQSLAKYIAPVVSGVFIVAILLIFNRQYWANDNCAILDDIKAGHIISFMPIVVGKALSFLYLKVSETTPWYGLMMYGCHWISLSLLVYSLLRLGELNFFRILTVIVLLAFYSELIRRVGYNGVSILLGFSALITLFVYVRSNEKRSYIIVLLLGLCFFSSHMIRMSGIKAAVIFSAPAIAAAALGNLRKEWKYYIVFIIPVLILMPVNKRCQRHMVTPEQKQFKRWNGPRGSFHVYPLVGLNWNNKKLFDVNNWTRNDYAMLLNWQNIDENKFNVKTIRNVHKYSETSNILKAKEYLKRVKKVPGVYKQNVILLILFATMVLLVWTTCESWRITFATIHILFALVLMAYMAVFMRFPDRIAYPILLGCSMWTLCLFFKYGEQKTDESIILCRECGYRKYLTILACVVLVILCCIRFTTLVRDNKQSIRERRTYNRCVKKLEDYNADFLIVSGALDSELRDPLQVYNDKYKRILMGWAIFSPRFYEVLKSADMQHGHEVYPKLVDNKNAYVISTQDWVDRIIVYLKETNGLNCKAVQLEDFRGRYKTYRIVSS